MRRGRPAARRRGARRDRDRSPARATPTSAWPHARPAATTPRRAWRTARRAAGPPSTWPSASACRAVPRPSPRRCRGSRAGAGDGRSSRARGPRRRCRPAAPSGATSISERLRSIALMDRRCHVLRRLHRHVARQLAPDSWNIPASLMKPGIRSRRRPRRPADPRAAPARSRGARTWWPSRSSRGHSPSCPTARETNTRWPWPRASIPCDRARASTIGARRLTASARSISSTLNESSTPVAGSAALATRMSAFEDLRRAGARPPMPRRGRRRSRARRPQPPAGPGPQPGGRSARAVPRARPAPARSPGRCHRSRR